MSNENRRRSTEKMKKKWLSLLVVFSMLVLPMTKLKTIETERLMTRAVSNTAKSATYETMLALLTVAVNRARYMGISDMERALVSGGFQFGFTVDEHAQEAAHAVMLGERMFDADVVCFSTNAPKGSAEHIGHFYFY